jgi:hypothetical protein
VTYRLGIVIAVSSLASGCSKASASHGDGGADAVACSGICDQDGDGVPDGSDQCPNTKMGDPVNQKGCSDSQLMPVLNPAWPPYNLTWTPTGDLGRAGGVTWTYSGIQRGDLFHIYWILCDDPADPCGMSLDGPIDPTTESWQYDATTSNLALGKLSFTNTTHIVLSGTTTDLNGRLTVNVVGDNNAPMFFQDVGSLHVHARDGFYGAEIKGTGFVVTAIAEVLDPASSTYTPYLDYYDAQPGKADPGDAGGNAFISFGGSFYDK